MISSTPYCEDCPYLCDCCTECDSCPAYSDCMEILFSDMEDDEL